MVKMAVACSDILKLYKDENDLTEQGLQPFLKLENSYRGGVELLTNTREDAISG